MLSLESISRGKALRAPRIVLLGVEKIGKSTFASQADSPIFIPVKGEEGLDQIESDKFPVAKSYDELIEMLGVLYRDSHEYRTIIIDSTSTLEPLVWAKTCQENGQAASIEKVGGGFGKGYIEALKYWREIMDGLDALRDERNMACVLIGHVTTKTFMDPLADPYDTYEFDINKKAAAALYRWADCIFFARFKTLVKSTEAGFNKKHARGVGGEQRVLYTQKRDGHPGGNRYGLPYELPLDWSKLKAHLEDRNAAIAPEPAIA